MDIFLNEEQFQDVFESHIKIETYSKSIDSLFNSVKTRKKINYKPYYQRNYVWDDSKASYFIESILLGTEIPPLIFFEEDNNTEVIDGRQRFETLKRFIEGDFSLSKNGLTSLIDLSKMDVNILREKMPVIYDAFIDAKVRIIGFKLVNNPPSDPLLIDKIKKEIFGRYNSGITPLKRAEIDNAVYDSDSLSQYFKKQLKKDANTLKDLSSLFLRQVRGDSIPNIESVMQFIRKSLVIYRFPIKTYAGGKSRTELISKFYEFNFSDIDEPSKEYEEYVRKINCIKNVRNYLQHHEVFPNRLFFECLLWGVNILSAEELDYQNILDEDKLEKINIFFTNSSGIFELTDSHYGKETLARYDSVANLLEELFEVKFTAYLQQNKGSEKALDSIMNQDESYKEELEKLESLRITKPDPSRNTIDDLVRTMQRNRFLVRPSYQRSEVINLAKSSAIIESMLLGIMLPAIFIYKRTNGVSEVIDGQQRLLTILGFIGERYLDETNNICYSKNHEFRMRNPRILKDLKGKCFDDLSEELQERILEFDLFVVEIEERLNPDFDPVDLFIRLNDKPFPIRDNSFEMWNSWADKDVIDQIKSLTNENRAWFYIRNAEKSKLRDRMNNEELYTVLTFFDYRKNNYDSEFDSYLDIYQKTDRINARIKKKKDITGLFLQVSENEEEKEKFIASIQSVHKFLKKVKLLLGSGGETELKEKLDKLLSSGTSRKYFVRTLQDIYVLWRVVDELDITTENRQEVLEKMEELFTYMKNIPSEFIIGDKGYDEFSRKVDYMLGNSEFVSQRRVVS